MQTYGWTPATAIDSPQVIVSRLRYLDGLPGMESDKRYTQESVSGILGTSMDFTERASRLDMIRSIPADAVGTIWTSLSELKEFVARTGPIIIRSAADEDWYELPVIRVGTWDDQ